MKCLSTGRDKLVFGYQKILQALQKYPIPILTEDQALQLQGVGQKTSVMIVKLINQQYANEQNIPLLLNEAIMQDNNEEIMQLDVGEINPINYSTCPVSLLNYGEEMLPEGSKIDFSQFQFRSKKPRSEFLAGLDEDLLVLKKIGDNDEPVDRKPCRAYAPSKNSKGWSVLISLKNFNRIENRSFATKRDIKKYALQDLKMEISQWNCLDTLERNGLIQKCQFGDEIKYQLTDDGCKLSERFIEESALVKQKENEEQVDMSQIEVILLIDNRERFQGNNRQIINEKLINIHGLKCRLVNLPIGDFLWIARVGKKEYVLDCIVERKTIADLAHSIIDKRYKDQKYRLKNCGLSRLFYLIEGTSLNNVSLSVSRSVIDKAIRQTQIRDGFMIQQTENLEESLLWISRLTRSFIVKQEQLTIELQSFLSANSNKIISIQQQWGNMICNISGAGQEVTKYIVDRWPTPLYFYEQINSVQDKIGFLQAKSKEKEKGSKVKINQTIAQLIVILFTQQTYPNDKNLPQLQ